MGVVAYFRDAVREDRAAPGDSTMIPIQDTVPRRSPPLVTYVLIMVNTAVFLFELWLPEPQLERLLYLFGMVPARYSHPEWAAALGFPLDDYWPFLTSMFLHSGWLHFLGNMWFLWLFGDNVEDRMGPWRFLAFYLLCGLAAGLTHWFTNQHSTVPAIGASGAIAGVMGAYLVMFPLARIVAVVPIFFYPAFVEIPAFFYLLFWFFMQFFSGTLSLVAPSAGGGVAWWAHVGGFAAGIVLLPLFRRSRRHYRRFMRDELGWEGAWRGFGPPGWRG